MINTKIKIFLCIAVVVFLAALVVTIKNVSVAISDYRASAAALEEAAKDRLPGLVCPAIVSGTKPGDSGESIAELQRFFRDPNVEGLLNVSDEDLAVTGVYDKATEATLIAFQQTFPGREPVVVIDPPLVKMIQDVCTSIKFNSQIPE